MDATPPAEKASNRHELGFVDGFQFGCGFFIAAAVAALLVILGIALISLVLSLLGVRLLEDLLGIIQPLPSLLG
jgi:hypothetical protein